MWKWNTDWHIEEYNWLVFRDLLYTTVPLCVHKHKSQPYTWLEGAIFPLVWWLPLREGNSAEAGGYRCYRGSPICSAPSSHSLPSSLDVVLQLSCPPGCCTHLQESPGPQRLQGQESALQTPHLCRKQCSNLFWWQTYSIQKVIIIQCGKRQDRTSMVEISVCMLHSQGLPSRINVSVSFSGYMQECWIKPF